MSAELVDKLLREIKSKANDTFGRVGVNDGVQQVAISKAALTKAFESAFGHNHEKTFPDSPNPFEKDKSVFKEATEAAFVALRTHLANKTSASRDISTNKRKNARVVIFTSDTHQPGPYDKMKEAGIKVINDKLNKLKKRPLSKGQETDIKGKIHKLHDETTAGLARLSYSLKTMEKDPAFDSFWTSVPYTRLENKYGDVRASFEVYDEAGLKKEKIRTLITVKLKIGSQILNPSGKSPRDWTRIAPKLTKELRIWARQHDWGNQKGSKSIKDKASDKLEAEITKKFIQVKGAKVIKAIPAVTSMTKKQKNKLWKGKVERYRDPKTGRFISAATAAKRKVQPSIINLKSLINTFLPETVARNMGLPALVYRTGRFAQSTRVTGVTPVRGKVPIVNYTYQKSPYQIFEQGTGSPPWNTPEREPRDLIEDSILEIAKNLKLGYFNLRRV